MEIYNSHLLNNKQRFWKSLLYGCLAALVCAIVVGYLMRFTAQIANITFPILYLAIGYIIASAINKAGGGIGKKYSYMGATLTFLSILLSNMFLLSGLVILIHPENWIPLTKLIIMNWFNFQGTNILSLLFIIWGIYIGYKQSDITSN